MLINIIYNKEMFNYVLTKNKNKNKTYVLVNFSHIKCKLILFIFDTSHERTIYTKK